jgi:hypothetical protein
MQANEWPWRSRDGSDPTHCLNCSERLPPPCVRHCDDCAKELRLRIINRRRLVR